MRLRALKTAVIQDLFVRTADENYMTARWCNANGLYTDFLWLGLHATEKYLKAILLMNDKMVKKFGHNIDTLYAKTKILAGSLLPDYLPKPDSLNISFWIDRTTDDFIIHLMKFGNPDNRYLIYGYNTLSQDLHMLDQLVWAIRRLIIPLEHRVGPDRPDGTQLPTNREMLERHPNFNVNLGMLPLDQQIHSGENTPLRQSTLNLNFSFAPSNFSHLPMRGGSSSFNPVIYRHIFEPLAAGAPDQVEEASELAYWLIQNVKLPKGKHGAPDLDAEIKDAVAKGKQRHRLP